MFKSRIAGVPPHLLQQHQAASCQQQEKPKKKKATGAAAQFSSASASKTATPGNEALPSSEDRQSEQSRFYYHGCDSNSSGYHKTRLNLAQAHRSQFGEAGSQIFTRQDEQLSSAAKMLAFSTNKLIFTSEVHSGSNEHATPNSKVQTSKSLIS